MTRYSPAALRGLLSRHILFHGVSGDVLDGLVKFAAGILAQVTSDAVARLFEPLAISSVTSKEKAESVSKPILR